MLPVNSPAGGQPGQLSGRHADAKGLYACTPYEGA